MARHVTFGLVLAIVVSQPAAAQNWAQKMFQTTSHDFGTIARAAKEEFRFELKNIYVDDIHIAGVRSSCGCTIPRVEKPLLKTHEQGAIVARINTLSFLGKRTATVTVTFDKPYRAQVQLQVSCYIRKDVVLHPGSAVLGSVEEGTYAEKTLAVNYAGRNNWKILEVLSENPHLSGAVIEKSRGGGRVAYDLVVRLDEEAPAGYVRDHLVLVTDDRRMKGVPVTVEAVVEPGITVSPDSLFMGVVQPGQKVTKQLVVRGRTPFRIVAIGCDGNRFECRNPDEGEPKPVHLIPVTFVAGEETGRVSGRIRIKTDLGDAAPELSAYAVISPQ
jgi:hypothetical protein